MASAPSTITINICRKVEITRKHKVATSLDITSKLIILLRDMHFILFFIHCSLKSGKTSSSLSSGGIFRSQAMIDEWRCLLQTHGFLKWEANLCSGSFQSFIGCSVLVYVVGICIVCCHNLLICFKLFAALVASCVVAFLEHME